MECAFLPSLNFLFCKFSEFIFRTFERGSFYRIPYHYWVVTGFKS